jgi:hypothetical protein
MIETASVSYGSSMFNFEVASVIVYVMPDVSGLRYLSGSETGAAC